MKRSIVFAALAALVLNVACQKIEILNPEKPVVNEDPAAAGQVEVPAVFSASLEDARTKVTLAEDGEYYDVLWQEGDGIRINGYDFSIDPEVQPEGYGAGYTKAIFSGNVVAGSSIYQAWYPASLSVAWYYQRTLPSEQSYVADNVREFPLYAESADESLQFKALCGIINLNLKGAKNISEIGLLDKSDSPKGLSGLFDVVDFAAVTKNASAAVTLRCSEPVALDSDGFTSFFITVPAGQYEKLQITITADDESYAILTSNKTITVQRGMITDINLSRLNFKKDASSFTYVTHNTTKYSKYAVGADASIFGDGLTVVGHDYDSATRTGVITLSGIATKVGNSAFQNANFDSIVLPETIESIGNSAFMGCSYLTSINKPDSLKVLQERAFCNANKLPDFDLTGITSIGKEAFSGCTSFARDIVISDCVEYLGDQSFKNTASESVTFNAIPAYFGGNVFASSKITALTFNVDVDAIPGYMFEFCRSLASITFNGNLRSVGYRAFYNCDAILDIDFLPESCSEILGEAFMGCKNLAAAVLPTGLTTLTEASFYGCEKLESVTFPTSAGFTTIPNRCFYDCKKLTSATIPSNVTRINYRAFANCGFTALPQGWGRSGITYGENPFYGCPVEHLTFPDNWTSIPDQFCREWSSLTSVDLGSGIASIGQYAFYKCTKLTSVTIPSNVTNIGYQCFDQSGLTSVTGINRSDLTLGGSVFESCQGLQSVDLTNRTTIPDGTFYNCKNLSNVSFSEGLLTIETNAFYNCQGISSVVLPSTVTTLGNTVFRGCTALTYAELGTAITTVGSDVFNGDNLMTTLVVRAPAVPRLNGKLNSNGSAPTLDIYVPADLIETYQTTNYWKEATNVYHSLEELQ